MALEDTRRIVILEASRDISKEVNEYLGLGWNLIDKFVTDYGDPDRRHETIHFILAWQNDEEPKTPEHESILRFSSSRSI